MAFLLLGFLSGSRTLMLGLFVGAIIEWILVGKFKATITKKKMIFLAVAIIVVAIVFLTNRDIVFRKVMEIADLLDIKNRVKTEGSSKHTFIII